MANYKKRLHELDKIDHRSLIYGSLVGAALLAVFAFVFFLVYVLGETREVVGTIVSFETIARKSSPIIFRRIYVRLDDGHTVSARIDGHITPKIGRRALLRATKMPLIGLERFRFREFVEEHENSRYPSQYGSESNHTTLTPCRAKPLMLSPSTSLPLSFNLRRDLQWRGPDTVRLL